MSAVTISNLSPKFQPYLIGSSTFPVIKEQIDAIYKDRQPLKGDYIYEAGKWILKFVRTDGLSTPDTHLYRVRKAEKIRTYIQQNNLGDHIVVPKKYLYWDATRNQFCVVAEKMNLSPEVATPASQEIEAGFKSCASELQGQCQALSEGKPRRSLTPTQAKALAELSVLGYTDLSYNNLYFTSDGKVAIIDTEPHKRSLKKMRSSLFQSLFFDKGSLLTMQSIAGIAKLKLYTDNPAALQEIQKVEKNHVLWRIAQLITKISLVALAIYFTPTITARIPVAALAKALKISFIAIAVIKDLFLIFNVINVYGFWSWSHQGPQGVGIISNMEMKGVC